MVFACKSWFIGVMCPHRVILSYPLNGRGFLICPFTHFSESEYWPVLLSTGLTGPLETPDGQTDRVPEICGPLLYQGSHDSATFRI